MITVLFVAGFRKKRKPGAFALAFVVSAMIPLLGHETLHSWSGERHTVTPFFFPARSFSMPNAPAAFLPRRKTLLPCEASPRTSCGRTELGTLLTVVVERAARFAYSVEMLALPS